MPSAPCLCTRGRKIHIRESMRVSMAQRKRKYDPTKFSNIVSRANSSAIAGLPISYALNIVIVIPLTLFMVENNYQWYTIAMIIAIPFYVASLLRMVTIDWVWFKYKINIDPKHLLKRLYNHLKVNYIG